MSIHVTRLMLGHSHKICSPFLPVSRQVFTYDTKYQDVTISMCLVYRQGRHYHVDMCLLKTNGLSAVIFWDFDSDDPDALTQNKMDTRALLLGLTPETIFCVVNERQDISVR